MLEPKRGRTDDEGVSAVIGVILMVAITVAIAATVYIWVGGFGVGDTGGESASATVQTINQDATNDWIRVTLSSGDNAPYSPDDVSVEVLDNEGAVHSTICNEPDANDTLPSCENDLSGDWDVGSSKFIPCSGEGAHQVTLTILGTAIADRSVSCSNAAQT